MDQIRKRKSNLDIYFDRLDECPAKRTKAFEFYQKLRAFYRKKWNTPLRAPNVQGVEVDLYKLYETVMSMGGWLKICQDDRWFEVAEILGITEDCFLADHAVKTLYLRYLSKYEQNETVGDIDDMMESEFGRTSSRRQFSTFVPNECPIPNLNRRDNKASTSSEPDYNRLIRSILSGLPNEIDFAVNVCTLLSHPGPRLLRISNATGLMTLLVALSGIFDEYDEDLISLYKDVWQHNNGHNFFRFWASSGLKKEELDVLVPQATPYLEDVISSLTEVNESFTSRNPVSWRVQQILTIIRNLSFESVNRVTMAQHWPLMKFLLTCANCKHPPLYTSALDALSNLACDIELTWERLQYSAKHLLLETLSRGIFSEDKFKAMRCMELLGGLSTHEKNESLLSDFLSLPLLKRIVDLVGVKDIMLCVYTLECLYQLSEIGPSVCESLASVPHITKILLSMATIEAVSFGKDGLIGMKVVEYHNPLSGPPPSLQVPQPSHPSVGSQVTTQHVMNHPTVTRPPTVGVGRPPMSSISHPVPILQQAPLPPVQPPTNIPNHVPTGQFGCDPNIERLTFNWIRQNCVFHGGSWTARGELYAAYVDDLRNHHHSLSGSLNTFSTIMTAIFPEVQFKMAESAQTPLMAALGIRLAKPHKLVNQQGAMVAVGHPPSHNVNNVLSHNAHASIPPQTVQIGPTTTPSLHYPSSSSMASSHPVMQQILQKPNGVPNGLPQTRRPSVPTPQALYTPSQGEAKSELVSEGSANNQVCGAVVEARDLLDEGRHETRIVRVENVNCTEIQTGALTKISRSVLTSNSSAGKGSEKRDIKDESHSSTEDAPAEVKKGKLAFVTGKLQPRAIPLGGDYMCEWDGCGKLFSRASYVIDHLIQNHLPSDNGRLSVCKWPNCDATERSKWSLVTHLQDHHASEQHLRTMATRRRDGTAPKIPAKYRSDVVRDLPPHPGYTRNAAAEAIGRHAFKYLPREITDEPEGPVTRSIRLTSCLILRNMARYSSEGRKLLRRHERTLCWLSLSRLEGSTVLAQLLGELHPSGTSETETELAPANVDLNGTTATFYIET